MDELKPCPFCGQNPKADYLNIGGYQWTKVFCSNPECPSAGPLETWNTRPIEDALRAELAQVTDTKDAAYHERNQIVAALAKVFPSSMERHTGEDWGPDWQWVCFIGLPTGQASWHIHSSELGLFNQINHESGWEWDGHTTEEKYNRLNSIACDHRIKPDVLNVRIQMQWDRIHELEAELAQARKITDDYSDGYRRAKESFDAELARVHVTERPSVPLVVVPDYMAELAQARQRIVELEAVLDNVAGEDPMNQDELGGCVWCGGKGPETYSGKSFSDHWDDCAWVAARKLLPTPPAEDVKGE